MFGNQAQCLNAPDDLLKVRDLEQQGRHAICITVAMAQDLQRKLEEAERLLEREAAQGARG
jgi:hypothetical protein